MRFNCNETQYDGFECDIDGMLMAKYIEISFWNRIGLKVEQTVEQTHMRRLSCEPPRMQFLRARGGWCYRMDPVYFWW